MIMPENKQLIKQRFDKNNKTYNQHAFVQKNMADELIENLVQNCGSDFRDIYEIGCGTGILTKQIVEKLRFDNLYANDIVESSREFVKILSDKIIFTAGDAETMLPDKQFDLIISNAVFQWFSDLPAFLAKICPNLKPNGILAFTTFGAENLREISAVTNCGLKYPSLVDIETAAEPYFDCLSTHSENHEAIFDSPVDILKHIKYTGTNGINQKHWVKRDLAEFERKYREQFSADSGVKLTYNPMRVILKSGKSYML